MTDEEDSATDLDNAQEGESAGSDHTLEDTGESSPDQPEQGEEQSTAPTGSGDKPWVDYVPVFTYKTPENLAGRLEETLDTTNEILKVKELFKLATMDQELHDSYYRLWVDDSNRLFRMAVLYKRRLSKLGLSTPQDEQEQVELPE